MMHNLFKKSDNLSKKIESISITKVNAINTDGRFINDSSIHNYFSIAKNGDVILDKQLNARADLASISIHTSSITTINDIELQQRTGLLQAIIINKEEAVLEFVYPSIKHEYYTFNFIEEQPVGSMLGSLLTTKSKSNKIHFYLEANEKFNIDTNTGKTN